MDITGTALPPESPSAVFVWGKWLPYHFARVQACVGPFREAGLRVLGVQYSDISTDYKIVSAAGGEEFEFFNLGLGDHETDFRPMRIVRQWPAFVRRHRCRIVFAPSYWNWSITITLLSRMLGCRVIMMNESHAGTEQATGWKRWIKRHIVKRFDAALVGGEPHKRHFAALGIPADKIFTGYDAVENALFAAKADEVRSMPSGSENLRVGEEHGAWSMEQDQKADEIRAAQKRGQGSGNRGQSEGGEDSVSVFSVQQEEKAEEVRTPSSQRPQSEGNKEEKQATGLME